MLEIDLELVAQDAKDHKLGKYASHSDKFIIAPVAVETFEVISLCITTLLHKIGRKVFYLKKQWVVK